MAIFNSYVSLPEGKLIFTTNDLEFLARAAIFFLMLHFGEEQRSSTGE